MKIHKTALLRFKLVYRKSNSTCRLVRVINQGCALRKIEGSLVLWNCKIQGAQHMNGMKNLRFSSRLREKVRCQGPRALLEHSPVNAELKDCSSVLWTKVDKLKFVVCNEMFGNLSVCYLSTRYTFSKISTLQFFFSWGLHVGYWKV